MAKNKVNMDKRKGELLKQLRSSEYELELIKESLNGEMSPEVASIEREEIGNWFRGLKEVLLEMQTLSEEAELEEYKGKLLQCKKEYLSMMSVINKCMKPVEDKSEPIPKSISGVSENSSVFAKLPVIQLPHFDGQQEKYNSFMSEFYDTVETNPSLSNSQKLGYLKRSLRGSALLLIEHLEQVNDNFEIAKQILIDQYENLRLSSDMHILKMVNIAQIKILNAANLSKLTNDIYSSYKQLETLHKKDISSADFILVPILSSKLDNDTRQRWEEKWSRKDQPTVMQLIDFLRSRIDIISRDGATSKSTNISSSQVKSSRNSYHVNMATQSTSSTIRPCLFCKESHRVYECPAFAKMSVEERNLQVRLHKLCINCLNPGHFVTNCKVKVSCKFCNKSHSSLIHTNPSVRSTEEPKKVKKVESTCHFSQHVKSTVLMATAAIYLQSPDGNKIQVRCLLDSGSMNNLISEKVCQVLRLTRRHVNSTLKGISSVALNVKHQVDVGLLSSDGSYRINLSCLVLPKVTSAIPTQSIDMNKVKIPSYITLADPNYGTAGSIDLILGSELFFTLLQPTRINIEPSLYLQQTLLGWIVAGKVQSLSEGNGTYFEHLALMCSSTNSNSNLDQLVTKFWEVEEIPKAPILSKEEVKAEQVYKDTVMRDPTGKYTVALPFSKSPSALGHSYDIAKKRFEYLERKLNKNNELKEQYTTFMKEYMELGHMKEVPQEEFELLKAKEHYFLAHHAIIREGSSTTKLRVVFDASMSTSNGVSLNNVLLTGPQLQQELFSVLLRFRVHKYSLVADIEKMYRQIWIRDEDTKFQLILWRATPEEPVKVFKLLTVTYGTASAPYLAIRTLHQLASDEAQNYPKASQILMNDFYVDDLVTGASSEKELHTIYEELQALLAAGGMNLRKWFTNCSPLMSDITNAHREPNYCIRLNENQSLQTLGSVWAPEKDQITFITEFPHRTKITKRSVLSDISRLFDIMGIVNPFIVSCKIFIRKLWLQNLQWDDLLSQELKEEWEKLVSGLAQVNNLRIPRRLIPDEPCEIQLHAFADSSEEAFGAVLYVRTISLSGNSSVRLLCSKSRVTPTKTQSIPRLELCGALLASKLVEKMKVIFGNTFFNNVFLWTDSTIVLHWINIEPCKLQTFVANRTRQILELTQPSEWNHVPSQLNPADLLSRGSHTLSDLWWKGPEFLVHGIFPEPYLPQTEINEELLELKKESVQCNSQISVSAYEELRFNNISSYSRLIRVMAHVLKFIKKLKTMQQRQGDRRINIPKSLIGLYPSFEEREEAKVNISKMVQREIFLEELKCLRKGEKVSVTNRYFKLSPFLDSRGLICVGGRLHNASCSSEAKHPILLPFSHPFTRLVAEHVHSHNLHCGPSLTLCHMRQSFWPINGLHLCKNVCNKCITCFRASPKPCEYPTGQLPTPRVKGSSVFEYVGTDFAGPFSIRTSSGRHATYSKFYLCVFTCMSTKACHLEVVSDLSSEAFIACLKRFISRRGYPFCMYSDNGRNYVGANRILSSFLKQLTTSRFQASLGAHLPELRFSWKFIPCYSPNFGGIWEAVVKSFKTIFKRITKDSNMTLLEFITLVHTIEAQLNSRPLTPLSMSPNDLEALTPGHFLIGRSLKTLMEPEPAPKHLHVLKKWEQVRKLQALFWQRWHVEYLSHLQLVNRKRSNLRQLSLHVGQLVLLKDENIAPSLWILARIVKLHPGADGITRVVTVRTTSGETTRTTSKVCPLPDT